MSSEPSRAYGRYRVLRVLGAGGMGEVCLARDELLARDVAIKTLLPLGFSGQALEDFRARFLNEARAVAALSHPHVVRVFDLGFEGEVPYLVMEVVAGTSLRERLKSGDRLTAGQARGLGIQIARALEAAHARGILHRDVKPANVLEAEPDVWKLADFGVAHLPDSSLTITGQFVGSPAYAAPESLLAGEFSGASDVYGLGATLHEALTGLGPREGKTDPTPIATRRADLPPELAELIDRMLLRDPGARPTAAQVAAALSGSWHATPTPVTVSGTAATMLALPAPLPPRRSRLWIPIVGALLVGLVAIVVISQRGSQRPALPFSPPSATEPVTPGNPPVVLPPLPADSSARSRDQEKRWQRAQDRLSQGYYNDAAKELRKMVEKDPGDAQAQDLLRQLETSGFSGRGGKHDD